MGRLLTGLTSVIVLVGLFLALVWIFQRRLIYIPLTHSVPPAGDVLPGAQEILLSTADGLGLGAWVVPAAAAEPAAWVIVFNGNAGDRSFRAPLAAALSRLGYGVLLFDYRGYGGNPGRPTEAGLALDARAAREALLGRPEVDPARIVYFGESLGAAVAVALAVEHPPAALILRSPFTSLADVGRLHYPFLPVGLILKDRYPSLRRIGGVNCPMLVMAGGSDQIVPAKQSRRLFEAAPEPKRWVVLPAADHNTAEFLVGSAMLAEVDAFLTASLGPPR